MSSTQPPPLSLPAELRSYVEALFALQPSLASSVAVDHSPAKGRYLRALRPFAPSSPVFHESAVLSASDDAALCVACHARHPVVDGRPVVCAGYRRYREIRSALNAVTALAVEMGYGETRGLLLGDFLVHSAERSKTAADTSAAPPTAAAAASTSSPSLAASFALPPPPAPTFSFAMPPDKKTPPTSSPPSASPLPPTASASSAASDATKAGAESTSSEKEPSLASLGLSAVFSLDPGPASLAQQHSAFASRVWQLLPLTVRRSTSAAALTRLLCVLEVNAHEVVDEAGEKGEGLFPFFALIEHSCRENCAFTALSPSAQSASLAVSVHCIRHVAADEGLSINYAPPYLPTAQRRAYLQERYHFHCTCPVCEGAAPDRCRAFVCGGCSGGVVEVWGEGREEDGLRAWRCSGGDCGAEVTEAKVRHWREAERYVGGEVQRLMERLEAEQAEEAEPSKDLQNKRKQQWREELDRVALLLQPVVDAASQGLDSSDSAPLSASARPLDAIEEEEEGAAADGSSLASSAPLSKTQLKNRKRRAKAKAVATLPAPRADLVAALHASHHHVHALLDLTLGWYRERKEWDKAVAVQRVRLSNVRRVVGEGQLHWLEAVEWSVLGELYDEMGDAERRKDAFARCHALNVQCFGQQAASTLR